jgi:serine/threonine protein kinase
MLAGAAGRAYDRVIRWATMGASPAKASVLVGARLGAYELVRLVGHGATASVFEGVHTVLGKRVGIKVLHEHLTRDEQTGARFLREGRVAARLQHPHVLEVLDLGQDGNLAWLVMEFLDGRDLRQELVRRHQLPLEEATALLLPIASALEYAHGLGAVHRDIKPANVFLARDELDRIVPKIVDFGLSKLEGLPESRPLTESEIVAGSVSYMAPEQTYGIARTGPDSDQFSFAAVFYECVTGHAPFVARTFYELIERIRESHAKPPSEDTPSLPAALDAVLLRALSARPADRWPSMRAMAEQLLPLADEQTRDAWRDEFVESPDTVRNVVASPRGLRAAPASRPFERTTTQELCPPLPCPAGASPFTIKGLPYRGFVYFASRALPGGLEELFDALDDEPLRGFLVQPFLASSRYDVLPLRPLASQLAQLLGKTFDELVSRGAALQARYDARTVFKHLFGGATLDNWHERVVRFGTQYYGFGQFTGEREGDSTVVLRHVGVPEYLAPWYAPMQRGYSGETPRILGAANVETETLPWVPGEDVHGFPTVTTATRIKWTRAP